MAEPMDDGLQHVYAPPAGLALGKVKDTIEFAVPGSGAGGIAGVGRRGVGGFIVPSAGLTTAWRFCRSRTRSSWSRS